MRYFLIGFGRMGQRHYQVLKKTGNNDITVFDYNTENTSMFPEVAIVSPELFNSKLESEKPTLVVIATTAPSHFSYLEKAIEAGVEYILCEKPLCVSLDETQKLEKLLKMYPNAKIAVNHQMRFMEQYTSIKKMTEDKHFGDLKSISIQGGNMGISMNGTHYFEMFRYLTNEYAHKIWAWLKPQGNANPRGNEFVDVAGSIRFESLNGKRFYMEISEDQGHGLFVTYTFSYGQIHVDELAGRVYASKRKELNDLSLPTTRYGMPAAIEIFDIEPTDAMEPTARVLNSLLQNADYPSIKDGIMAIKTLVGAYASSENDSRGVEINSIPVDYHLRAFPWA